MSTEHNKLIVRRFNDEFLDTGNFAATDELIASDSILYFASERQPGQGPEAFKQPLAMLPTAFPDIQWTSEEMVAEGDKVVERVVGRGTHLGEFMGIPPTGKQMILHGMALFRIANDKIVEQWAMPNLLGLLQQPGAVPVSEQAVR